MSSILDLSSYLSNITTNNYPSILLRIQLGSGTCVVDGALCNSTCDEVTDKCVPAPMGSTCSDGKWCNGENDYCDGAGNCIGEVANVCTAECQRNCSETTRSCNSADGDSCGNESVDIYGCTTDICQGMMVITIE